MRPPKRLAWNKWRIRSASPITRVGCGPHHCQGLQQKSATDPLGADDDIASAVAPLLDLVNRKMQAAKLKRDHDWQQLTQSLDGFRRTAQMRPVLNRLRLPPHTPRLKKASRQRPMRKKRKG